MKVLQIASGDFFSTYGGGQVYVKNIVDEMRRQGRDVTVVSFLPDGEAVRKDYRGADLYEMGHDDHESLFRLVEEIAPDVIHAHSHKGMAVQIGRALGIPVVITSHHGGIVCPAAATASALPPRATATACAACSVTLEGASRSIL